MTPEKETLLQELLHEKLGELIHYKGTCGSYELSKSYSTLINATYALLEAKLPLTVKGINNTSPEQVAFDSIIKMSNFIYP